MKVTFMATALVSAGLVSALAQSISEEEYLDVKMVCPTESLPLFEIYAQNPLGDRDRVTLTFANGEVIHVSLAASATGYPYEEVFGGTLKDLDAKGLRNANRIILKVAPLTDVCEEGGQNLRDIRRQHERNRSLLGLE